jgi:hypothetical protein
VNNAPFENRDQPEPGPFVHLVLIVQLSNNDKPEGQLYLVDVGYGSTHGLSGPIRPIPLIDDTIVRGSAPPEQHRIVSLRHPLSTTTFSSSGQSFPTEWALQARRNHHEDKWRTLYLFNLHFEFFQTDIDLQSFAVSTLPDGLMMPKVIVVKMLDSNDDPESLGRIILSGSKLVVSLGDGREELGTCKTEKERVDTLKEFCGIKLDPEDAVHIRDRDSAIPPR